MKDMKDIKYKKDKKSIMGKRKIKCSIMDKWKSVNFY